MSNNNETLFPKPKESKMRRPEAMERGKAYKLTALAQEKSKFPGKDGQDVFKSLAVYEEFGMVFYTYLPSPFDNKPDAFYEDLNKEISDKKDIRVVFYGKIGRLLQLEILHDGESVNQTKLNGVRRIEELESEEPPAKRQRAE